MLKTRIITALILAPCAIAAIYLLPLAWFALVFCTIAALGAYEFAGLAGIESQPGRAVYVLIFVALAAASWWAPQLLVSGLGLGCLLWIFAVAIVLRFPASQALVQHRWLVAGAGLTVCWSAWAALVVVRSAVDGGHWVLWSLVVVWGADIGAYFAGRRFGKRKLAPAVSPGKTWEGAWGGAIASVLFGSIGLYLLGSFSVGWCALLLALVVISVFGDLFESVLKRVAGVKDSGTLLPGHGGILDRIDSIVAVVPWLALVLLVAGMSNLG